MVFKSRIILLLAAALMATAAQAEPPSNMSLVDRVMAPVSSYRWDVPGCDVGLYEAPLAPVWDCWCPAGDNGCARLAVGASYQMAQMAQVPAYGRVVIVPGAGAQEQTRWRPMPSPQLQAWAAGEIDWQEAMTSLSAAPRRDGWVMASIQSQDGVIRTAGRLRVVQRCQLANPGAPPLSVARCVETSIAMGRADLSEADQDLLRCNAAHLAGIAPEACQ